MKPSELLRQKGWCKGNIAQDINGDVVPFDSDEACSFCMLGAIYKTLGLEGKSLQIRKCLNNKIGGVGVYNDNICQNKEDAIKILQEAEKEIGL